MARYRLIHDELQIDDGAGVVLWSGKPLSCSVTLVLPGLGGDYCVVLLDPDAKLKGAFRNLLRVSTDGVVAWRARLPTTGDDCYVSARWVDGTLVANSWSGYRVVIDSETGDIVNSTFTK